MTEYFRQAAPRCGVAVRSKVRRSSWTAVARYGALLAVTWTGMAGRLNAMQSASTSVPSARVMVYNIHAGKTVHGVSSLEEIAALVKSTNADIVLLQEVDQGTKRSGNVDQTAVLKKLTGLHGAFGSALDYDGGKYGVAILSRWPIVSDTLFHLPVEPPQTRSGGSMEPRGALRAMIRSPRGCWP